MKLHYVAMCTNTTKFCTKVSRCIIIYQLQSLYLLIIILVSICYCMDQSMYLYSGKFNPIASLVNPLPQIFLVKQSMVRNRRQRKYILKNYWLARSSLDYLDLQLHCTVYKQTHRSTRFGRYNLYTQYLRLIHVQSQGAGISNSPSLLILSTPTRQTCTVYMSNCTCLIVIHEYRQPIRMPTFDPLFKQDG